MRNNIKVAIQFGLNGIQVLEVDDTLRPTGRTFDVAAVLGTTFPLVSAQPAQTVIAQSQVAATIAPPQPSVQVQATQSQPTQQVAPHQIVNGVVHTMSNGIKYRINGVDLYAGYTKDKGRFVTWTPDKEYQDANKNAVVKSLADAGFIDIANAIAATKPLPGSLPDPVQCSVCSKTITNASVIRFCNSNTGKSKFGGKMVCFDCQKKSTTATIIGASEASATLITSTTTSSATVNLGASGADVLNSIPRASEASATPIINQPSISAPSIGEVPRVDVQLDDNTPPWVDVASEASGYVEVSDDYVIANSHNPASQAGQGVVLATNSATVNDADLLASMEVSAQAIEQLQAGEASPQPAGMDEPQGNVRRSRSRKK